MTFIVESNKTVTDKNEAKYAITIGKDKCANNKERKVETETLTVIIGYKVE